MTPIMLMMEAVRKNTGDFPRQIDRELIKGLFGVSEQLRKLFHHIKKCSVGHKAKVFLVSLYFDHQ